MQKHQSTSWSNHYYLHNCNCCFPSPHPSEHVCPITNLPSPSMPDHVLSIPEPTYISDSSSCRQTFSSNIHKYPPNYPSNSQNTSQNRQNEMSYHRNRQNSDNSNSNLSDTLSHQYQCSSNSLNRLSNLFLLNTLSTFLSRAGSRIRRHTPSPTPSSHTNLEEFTVVIPVLDNKTRRKNLNDSPMKNPPCWKRIFWVVSTVLNIYTFIGSILLMIILSINGNISKSFSQTNYIIIAIGTLEFAPRLMNIYQIHLYTNGRIGFIEALAIMFGKKELYLLYGKHHITYKQVSNVSYTSDALTFVYWAFLSFELVSEIQRNLENTIEFTLLHNRQGFLMLTLLSVVTLIILRISWGLIKRAVYFADRHA
ncbi:12857_t:CDS:2 [Dentiscutata erythropus]|uniref:12857_t:CDS:1 n=1 Tax=Dentiscutata erythropus TaxID=1348616 RepID=A0A9N8VHV0_9GLOM|nr:12857_t:CDS:2 [Dentiscutata erythropus]